MKIASVGYSHLGGAGLSSIKLHTEFLRLGHDSRFYVIQKKEGLPGLIRIKSKSLPNHAFYQPLRNEKVSIATTGLGNAEHAALRSIYEWADTILLRWVTGALSDWQIGYWTKLGKKPILWCLSDMAPITGGCHYSQGCDGYQSDCNCCPVVLEERVLIKPRDILQRRERLWGDITVVAPSKWLQRCAGSSRLFKGKDIRYIPTGVELDVFTQKQQPESRRKLNLPLGRKIIFSGAQTLRDYRKGFDLLVKSINDHFWKNSAENRPILVTAGSGALPSMNIETINLPHISSRSYLSELYSACDLTVLPYREDNLPNVLLESLACGTPVVAFSIGGIKDVVKNGINGFLVKPFDTKELAKAIEAGLVCGVFNRDEIRDLAVRELSITDQARRYLQLFEEKIKNKSHRLGHSSANVQ
jgi:glycosyltransferase involved in cell wall biosynthesis